MQEGLTKGQLGTKIGIDGEEFVNNLAKTAFLHDWCFINPKIDGKELCDLLIIFRDVAIIWQIKNTKLGKDGKMKTSDREKNLRQLTGAKRKFTRHKAPIIFRNSRGEEISIITSEIKEIFLISAFVGEEQILLEPSTTYNDEFIRNFTRGFIEVILKELDTTSDFIEYLRKSNNYLSGESRIISMGGEQQLLGWYIHHNRSFHVTENTNDGLYVFEDDIWDGVSKSKQFKEKKESDEISYFWDHLISLTRDTGSKEYILVAQEMAKLNRFDRRCISKAFWEAFEKANSQENLRHFRRIISICSTTYCFLFQNYNPEKQTLEEFRKDREAQLGLLMYCSRGKIPNNKQVIGIATECGNGEIHSFDFGMLDMKEWSVENQAESVRIQKETGIFGNLQYVDFHEDEYKKDN